MSNPAEGAESIQANKLIETEHENLILANKLIEHYEEKIKNLQTEIESLKLKIYQPPPGPIHVPSVKPRVRTTSELTRVLELRSLKSVGVIQDKND